MSNQGSKLGDKKKNDLLKKFLNAQQYTKTLKKNASNLIQQSNYTAYSYDEINVYQQMPQSAKLPSSKDFSINPLPSFETITNESIDYHDKKHSKLKKSFGFENNLTQSSNEIPYVKSKKSSYSQMEKSQGNKSVNEKEVKQVKKVKQYDVHSVNKDHKYSTQAMHESLGGMKTQSFFKLKNKKSFNYSNLHEYESQKLSGERQQCSKSAKHIKPEQIHHRANNSNQEFSPYDLSAKNFGLLLNQIQKQGETIMMYQECVLEMKKRILQLQEKNNRLQMENLLVESLKEELLQEKNKCQQLRDKLYLHEGFTKEYEKTLFASIQKIDQHYQQEIQQITSLSKQNQLLKFMLNLDLANNPEIEFNEKDKQILSNIRRQEQQIPDHKLQISKNLAQLKDKIYKTTARSKDKSN